MLTESLVEAFRTRLEALGFDLADLRIGGTPNRPLVQVRIDCPPRTITVEDCSRVSRALEAWLDVGGPLGNRYVLEVSSPGIDRPVRWHRHWLQFVGRDDGEAGRPGAGAGAHRRRSHPGQRGAAARRRRRARIPVFGRKGCSPGER